MNLSNPKIEGPKSLQTLIGDINREDPAEYTVVGTIPVPDWHGVNNHFQGIAPLNGVVKITGQISASADQWWTASFVERGNPATVTAVWGTQTYDHAGGIQRLGDLLPIGLEGDIGATVAFYDVRTRTSPRAGRSMKSTSTAKRQRSRSPTTPRAGRSTRCSSSTSTARRSSRCFAPR